jgi:WD40 repeat protein
MKVSLEDLNSQFNAATKRVQTLYRERQQIFRQFKDSVVAARYGKDKYSNNTMLFNIRERSLGCQNRVNGKFATLSSGRSRSSKDTHVNYKALFYNRFSYVVTINSHLHYPVYCLRFDRTGHFFITGADDYLVRVFCFGDSVFVNSGNQLRSKNTSGTSFIDPSTYARGAILVCTLKGHAGVINDICVSADNSFLATASEDGDCRVWGLKDGCQVAVLRGHDGGANMV